jgi:hypothetical protein
MENLLLNINEYNYPYKFYHQSEMVGPVNPDYIPKERISVELPFNLQYNDYTEMKMQTNIIVQFINDFPLDIKKGLIVIRLKWDI